MTDHTEPTTTTTSKAQQKAIHVRQMARIIRDREWTK